MNEQWQLLEETVGRLFPELDAEHGDFSTRWQRVEELGLPELFAAEEAGGFGGTWQDAFIVLRAAGAHAVAVPVAESIVARRLLAASPLVCQSGLPVTLAPAPLHPLDAEAGWLARAVPWPAAGSLLLAAGSDPGGEFLALVETAAAMQAVVRDAPASEPRADLCLPVLPAHAVVRRAGAVDELMCGGALMRAAQMAGALEAALSLTIAHVRERVQFGRALSQFQVVQHQLALLAEEAAAVGCAARAACVAADRGDAELPIAAAKLRANRAVHAATSIAHQLHGAMGFTREHALHHFTQRLWRWRSDFGNDRYWAARIGRLVTRVGADGAWDLLAR
jgi:acyl-CoA dehydrogenase